MIVELGSASSETKGILLVTLENPLDPSAGFMCNP